MDWFRSQHPNTGWNMPGQWGGQTPGNMQAWGQPRQAQTSFGSLDMLRSPSWPVR